MVLVSVVAPSVAGGVIESDAVALAGSDPARDVPAAATDAGAGASAVPGSEPYGVTSEPAFADGVEVVAAGAAAPARTSAVSAPAAGDDAVDDVTTAPGEVDAVL